MTRPPLLALPALLLIATSRWGAYLQVPGSGVFLTDGLLLAAGAVSLGVLLAGKRPARPRMMVALLLLPAVTALYLVFGGLTAVALRDAAPYLYLVVGALLALHGAADAKRGLELLPVALLLHAAWCVPAVLGVLPPLVLPGIDPSAPVFSVRSDVDSVLLGAAAVLLLQRSRTTSGLRSALCLLGATATAAAVVSQDSRAGLLGALVVVGSYSFAALKFAEARRVSPVLVATALMAAPMMLAVLLLSPLSATFDSGAVGRLRASLGYAASQETAGALRTQQARLEAWTLVERAVDESDAEWRGVGFGRHYVLDSGAYLFLSGKVDVRAPHNWFLNTYARLGLGGVVLWTIIVLVVMTRTLVRGAGTDDTSRLATATALGLLASASVGVVLESPFGVIPFVWLAVSAYCVATESGRVGRAAWTRDASGSRQAVRHG